MKFISKFPRWLRLGLTFPLIVLNGWGFLVVFSYFQSLISVLSVASILAFVLNYLVIFLVFRGFQREKAVVWVILMTVLLSMVVAVTLVPILVEQFNELIKGLPDWLKSAEVQLAALNDWLMARKLPINLTGISLGLIEKLSNELQNLTGQLLTVAVETISKFFDVLLTVILTFYLLLHGPTIWEGLKDWLPKSIANDVCSLLSQNFHNYFIGQASLALIIGLSMILIFLVLQVPLGLLFGLGVGLMALFPFGAPLSICAVSLLMAFNSFWLGVKVLIVAIIIEQGIENLIAPRLLGGFTGLNPVWVLIALLVGIKVAGVLGLLLAVPLAGFTKSFAHLLRSKRYDTNNYNTFNR